MDTKLTLSVNRNIVKKAKIYAQKNKTSISQIVEDYFALITKERYHPKDQKTHLIKDLTGIIKLPKGYDEKRDYRKYRAKKHK